MAVKVKWVGCGNDANSERTSRKDCREAAMKHTIESRPARFFIVILVFGTIIAGCGTTELASRWNEKSIRVDADLSDWADSTVFVEEKNIRVGITNDDDFLYVALFATDTELARGIFVRGLTLWFDPNGGERKTLGLRYPMGMMERGMDVLPRGRRNDPDFDQDSSGRFSMPMVREFEFLGPEERDRQRVGTLDGKGVEVELRSSREGFMYEAKIPLRYSLEHPYALETRAGETIGFGVELGSGFQGRPGGAGMGVPGSDGGRGRPGGGRGGVRGGGRMPPGGPAGGGRVEPIDFWFSVQLAGSAVR